MEPVGAGQVPPSASGDGLARHDVHSFFGTRVHVAALQAPERWAERFDAWRVGGAGAGHGEAAAALGVGWLSDEQPHHDADLRPFFTAVLGLASVLHEQTAAPQELAVNESWLLHGGAGAGRSHHHRNSYLTALCYLDAGSVEGALVLEDPRLVSRQVEPDRPSSQWHGAETVRITVFGGMAVVLPSWLRHWWEPIAADPGPAADRVAGAPRRARVAVGTTVLPLGHVGQDTAAVTFSSVGVP